MSNERSPLMYGSRGRPEQVQDGFDNRSFVFGGFDGIVASLSILSGAAGGQLSWRYVLIVGLSAVVANSLSLGISEFLSSKAHREFLQAEKRRELWEFKNYRDIEIMEMVNRFEQRGMERKDAESVVAKMAQYESFFVSLMVSEELGLQLPDDDDALLITDAFVMCISYGICGCIPLMVYGIAGYFVHESDYQLYIIAVCVSLCALCVLAIVKSSFSSATAMHSAIEAICAGSVCSALAYAVGAGLREVVTL
eukprot:gene29267-35334_t